MLYICVVISTITIVNPAMRFNDCKMGNGNNGYAPYENIEIYTLSSGVKIFAAFDNENIEDIIFGIYPDGAEWAMARHQKQAIDCKCHLNH